MDLKFLDYPYSMYRIIKAFICDRSQLYNRDIDNFFPKNENIGVEILRNVQLHPLYSKYLNAFTYFLKQMIRSNV